jgi:hypothetical protein
MRDNTEIAKDYTDWQVKEGGYARDMTLRDHFAGLAMQALVSLPDVALPDVDMSHDACANWAYRQADAMLKERSK